MTEGLSIRASRDSVCSLLTAPERASVSDGASTRLTQGEEYVDLLHIDRGVCRAVATTTVTGQVVARRAVHADSWRRVLAHLVSART